MVQFSRNANRVAVLAVVLMLAAPASATVVIESFDSFFNLGGTYGNWDTNVAPTTVITPGATALHVSTTGGWGGGWAVLGAAVDASSETDFELEVTFGQSNQVPVIVLGLEDGDGTFVNYQWWGLPATGNMILSSATAPNSWESQIGTIPGFDMSSIVAFHIQGDGNDGTGAPTLPADINFENLAATPEPASLALLALGGLAVLRRRR